MISITVVSKRLSSKLKIEITIAGCFLWWEKRLVPVVGTPGPRSTCWMHTRLWSFSWFLSAVSHAQNKHNHGYSDGKNLLYKHREIGLLTQTNKLSLLSGSVLTASTDGGEKH